LSANANAGGMEKPIITEAVANIGVRPYGKAGRVRKKRTHIRIVAHEKKSIKNKMKKKNERLKSKISSKSFLNKVDGSQKQTHLEVKTA